MLSRIRGAIDRTIAEEQARQQSSQQNAPPRSASNATRSTSGNVKRPRPKASPAVATGDADNDGNPDPALFEAAFVIDDDEPSRANTPQPLDVKSESVASKYGKSSSSPPPPPDGEEEPPARQSDPEPPAAPPTTELPTQIKTKLRKLEKLEATYPELLRSYRIAHGRATAIEPFERALRENTPLTSIKDPAALLEYLTQLKTKGDMVMGEFRRVSAENDALKQQSATIAEEKTELEKRIKALGSSNTGAESVGQGATEKSGSEFFSYEDEVPKLQQESVAATEQERDHLQSELEIAKAANAELQHELDITKSNVADLQQQVDSQATAQGDLDRQLVEVAGLKQQLENSQAQITTLEEKIAQQEQATKVEEVANHAAGAAQVDTNHATETQSLTGSRNESSQQPQPPPGTGINAKKNKNKKKKKAAANAAIAAAQTPPASPIEDSQASELHTELLHLKEEVLKKDQQIERLEKNRTIEEDLREEIETLRQDLLDIGQGHVESQEKIKNLNTERDELCQRIEELESELSLSTVASADKAQAQSAMATLQRDFEALTASSSALQTDLGAAQQLAQTRYRDLTDLRETLHKIQPEIKMLRQDAIALKAAKEDLATRSTELKTMEKREKELKVEITRAQKMAADRESEARTTNDKLTMETQQRVRLEDANRVLGRDLRRSEADKIELSAQGEKATRELEKLQAEMVKVRPQVRHLEDEVGRLRKELNAHKDDAELKSSQYNNAQNLLGSMRDQTHELSVQLKESQGQAEALEEELSEHRKLLGERNRESETMRRLLAEVDERADGKVRDIRARLDAAIEERDRLEDESTALARRKAREFEEVRNKLRDLERDNKALSHDNDEFGQREREWKRRREELEAVEAKAEAEVDEMRDTVSNLRTALDASEQQARDAERAKAELRKSLDDYRIRLDKLTKESKSLQAKLNTSSRSSIDSSRSGVGEKNGTSVGAGAADVNYIKTILLQFLEQKEYKMRAQLIPVLGKLLRFDKSDEQKWMAAVQHMNTK